ncbi:MAG: peptide deformylase [Gammaproteobacteria bacterium]|nr:MAG: peptide deformylase [Gammaproteobacteria bacterium]
MTILNILKYPDKRLKQTAKPVEKFDDDLKIFIKDLEQTRLSGPGAVGIAATQVGVMLRVIIVDISKMKKSHNNHGYLVLINPVITKHSGYVVGREGCLSVPDYTANVVRADSIVLYAFDQSAQQQTYQMSGFEARVVQHEIDHLDGLLFLDRMISKKSDLFLRKNK